jgi:hypothetical protein
MVRTLITAVLLSLLSGCATTASEPAAAGANRAAGKISMAIGREVADFTITGTEAAEAPTGYDGTRYTVKTNDGATYKCEILEPSRLGKIATWGMGSGADAMCTSFASGSGSASKGDAGTCNALLRAAKKC